VQQKIFSVLFVLAMSATVIAMTADATPPAVGDKAPDFTLSTVEGKQVQLSGITAKSRVALIVLRGFPGYQCPYCHTQVQDFMKRAESFAEAGTHVILVYPGPSDNLGTRATEFMKGKTLPENFDLLIDPDYKFTNQYG